MPTVATVLIVHPGTSSTVLTCVNYVLTNLLVAPCVLPLQSVCNVPQDTFSTLACVKWKKKKTFTPTAICPTVSIAFTTTKPTSPNAPTVFPPTTSMATMIVKTAVWPSLVVWSVLFLPLVICVMWASTLHPAQPVNSARIQSQVALSVVHLLLVWSVNQATTSICQDCVQVVLLRCKVV